MERTPAMNRKQSTADAANAPRDHRTSPRMANSNGRTRTFVTATTMATRSMSRRLAYDHSANGVCRSTDTATNTRFSTSPGTVSYTHLRAHETRHDLVCRLLLEKKKNKKTQHN